MRAVGAGSDGVRPRLVVFRPAKKVRSECQRRWQLLPARVPELERRPQSGSPGNSRAARGAAQLREVAAEVEAIGAEALSIDLDLKAAEFHDAFGGADRGRLLPVPSRLSR